MIIQLIVIVQLFGQVPQNGLVAWYPLNGNANNAAGNSNNGTIQGATPANDRFGNPNGAYNFTGGFITGSDTGFPQSAEPRSICGWFRPTSPWACCGAGRDIFVYGTAQLNGNALVFRAWENNMVIAGLEGPNVNIGYTLPQDFILNQWYFMVATYDGAIAKLYLDGQLVQQGAVSWSNSTLGSFCIGKSLPGTYYDNFFRGDIDDIRIYNRPLAQDEVQSLYQETGLPVSVTITGSANPVCSGTPVTFTATPVNGGTAPQYQWKVNASNAGTNNVVFTYAPANNDVVSCILTSNAPGATGNPATSNAITMSVTPLTPVLVTITASANPVCQGDTVHYTAHMGSSGSITGLQWFVNGLPVSGGNLNNGLVAYYPFNGNANDASGNGNNGVDVSATPTTDRFGTPNAAYNFAGLSNPQIIRVPNSPTLQFGNQASFSLWVHMNSFYGMDGWGNASATGFHVMFSKDFDRCCLYEGIGGMANGNFSSNGYSNGWYSGILLNIDTVPGSSLGQWYNITYVFTPTEARMFSNGQLVATKSGTTTFANSNSKDLYFGRLNPFWYPLNGKLDDVRFYNRALSNAEVWELYRGFDSTFSYVPQNGDIVTCVLTASGTCLSNNPDTSNAITMIVHPLPANIGQASGVPPSLQNGLVAYYPFNGNANDESGNGHNGLVNGASLTSDRLGGNNNAYSFDGINDFIEVTDQPNLRCRKITVSAWALTNISQPRQIIYKGNLNDASGEAYSLNSTIHSAIKINSNCIAGNGWQISPFNQVMNIGVWYHLVFTFNGDTVKNYLNGTLINKFAHPGLIDSCLNSNLRFGLNHFLSGNNGNPWNGKIDDISIYNRAISASEVACLYSGACNNLTAELASDSICVGNNTSLNIIHSQSGIKYQMLTNGANYGSFQTGNGNTLTFPINGLMQTTSFTVLATNTTTGCFTMLDSTFTVHVSALNAVVSPTATICNGNTATLTASGGTGYLWSNGMTSGTIVVSPATTTVYYVTVTNGTWCIDTDSVKVNVNPTPVPAVTGPNAICLGAVNIVYTTQSGMTGYTWSVSGGGVITAGAGTNSVTVTWSILGAQTVSVVYTNSSGCTAAMPAVLNVTVNPMPAPVITGNTGMCVASGYYDYTTEPGMANYTWNISPGGTILFGNGTSQLIATWDVSGAQWVRVNYTNSSGCTATAPSQLNIMVNPLPGAAGPVTGSGTVCAGATGISYSTTPIPDAVTYVWSLPFGASVSSGSGTNSILVDFGPATQSGDITVYGNNLCGNGTTSLPLHVNVSPLPGLAGTPTGDEVVCQGDTGVVYYVSPILNAANYTWEITGGGVITTGNGTNSIRAKFPTAPANCSVTVYGSNSCRAGLISPAKNVQVNLLPPAPVITQNDSELVSSAPAGNQWYYNGVLIPGADQQVYTPDKSGKYTVIATLSGCSSALSNEIYFIMTAIEKHRQLHVKVYPVPNDGKFRVYLNSGETERISLSVMNALGQKIYELSGIELNGDKQQTIDLRPVPPGVYTLVIEGENLKVVRKVVVE